MSKFLFTFGVIAFGLSSGYAIQVLIRKGIVHLPIETDRLRKVILQSVLLLFLPVTVIGAVWTMKINDPRVATLPFLGAFSLLSGGALAFGLSKILNLTGPQTGTLLVCGLFTNTGAIGGLICYVFLGETGFGLVPIFRLFEEVIYYAIGFPVARLYSRRGQENPEAPYRFRRVLFDPLIIVSVLSLLAGGVLNLSGCPRPEFYRNLNALLIPMTTIAFLFSIGLAMKISALRYYLKECMGISMIKFVIVPGTVTALGLLLGYRHIGEGLLLKAAVILSSMPVAFMALIPPTLYDLDTDLANSCWLITTGLLVIVLPVLFFILHWL
jgi:predicted permease